MTIVSITIMAALMLGVQEQSQGHHLPIQVALVLITHHLPCSSFFPWLYYQDRGHLCAQESPCVP